MVSHCTTVAFIGIEARLVDVQCHMSPGIPAFTIVGLPDKAVAESRERVRAALGALGLALPAKRITINLAPADLPKSGAHYDLPIAICVMAELGAIPPEEAGASLAMGELGLDGALNSVAGALPAALAAAENDRRLICPAANGREAAVVDAADVVAPDNLVALVNHFSGKRPLSRPRAAEPAEDEPMKDLADVKGQEKARRALEIAAAGGHNLLLVGPPGVGKSMLAERLPGLLPPLSPREALEASMVRSVAGKFEDGRLIRRRPFCEPHHSASMAAIIGGGRNAAPGQISIAHHGVLFMDELPEFSRSVLESLRQPLEKGETVIARANAHVRYPSDVQLVAAMNPCRCGHLADPGRACSRAPKCGHDYQARLSGPLVDRIDLHVETPPIPASELARLPRGEPSAAVAARVARARETQARRYEALGRPYSVNARAEGRTLDEVAATEGEARDLLVRAADKLGLSSRGLTRVLRIARTIADLDGAARIARPHVAEAVGYRRLGLGN